MVLPARTATCDHRGVRLIVLVLAVVVAGCDVVLGIKPPFDVLPAGVDPCEPDAIVDETIRITGVFTDSSTLKGIAQLGVDAIPGGVGQTDAAGMFAIGVRSSGAPRSVALTASGRTDYPRYRFRYQRPFVAPSTDVSVALISIAGIASLYGGAGIPQDAQKATLVVSVRDCVGVGVPNATVATTPVSARIVYQGGGNATDVTGVAYVLNAPPAASVEYAGTSFAADTGAGEVGFVFLVRP